MWITRESSLGLLALVEISKSGRVSAEKVAPVSCLAGVPCQLGDSCPTRPLWEYLEERIEGWLRELSLADLTKGKL
ncbi:hypothetical protein H5T57_00930 [Candidatus Bipolaricaulota bacterium]|nr:hypothetical protein [Candidatus Bipolaricaulota bacterium]